MTEDILLMIARSAEVTKETEQTAQKGESLKKERENVGEGIIERYIQKGK